MSKKNIKKAKSAVKAKKAAKVKKAVKKAKPASRPVKKKAASKAKAPAKKKPAKKVQIKKVAAKKAPSKKAAVKKVAVKKAAVAKTAKPVEKAPVKVQAPAKAPVKPVEKKPVASTYKKPAQRPDITRHNMPFHKKDQARQIIPQSKMDPNKTRYSDKELEEFKQIILQKLNDARRELTTLQAQLTAANEHGTDDTASTFKMLEDGSDSLAKEEAGQLAGRQKKFIEQLENALIRIENKTYGICRVTGKLIPKERLRAVPHTTQSIEAKLNQYRE